MTRPPRVIAAGVAVLLLVAGCATDEPDFGSPTRLIVDARISPGPISTLTAVVDVVTKPGSTLAATVRGPGLTAEAVVSGDGRDHEVQVVGLRAESTYDVVLTASQDSGSDDVSLRFTSGPLPDDLPPIEVSVADAGAVQPGVTILDARRWGSDAATGGVTPAYIVGLDAEAEVVWYHPVDHPPGDVDVTDHQTVVFTVTDALIREIDLLGRPLLELGSRLAVDGAVDFAGRPTAGPETVEGQFDSAHHEIVQLADGNLLTLSNELETFGGDDAQALCGVDELVVADDIVVELTPTGESVSRWDIGDLFDPAERPGTGLCDPAFPIGAPGETYAPDGVTDWTHSNAIVVDEPTNTMVVSVRSLDAVVGIRYRDDANGPAGELLWELGPRGTLELTGDSTPQFGQHAPFLTAEGTLLLYDNGNGRPGTTLAGGDDPPFSRAVEYALDLEAGTATQVWEHRDVQPDGTPTLALFLGDANRLANGNTLINHGGMTEGSFDVDGVFSSRIVEVTRDGEIVLDLTVGVDPSFTVYRVERIAGFADPG